MFNCDWCVCVRRSGWFMVILTQLQSSYDQNHVHFQRSLFPAAPDPCVFVSCRTTLTWTRRLTSWWRTSWLMTKACRTRRATASVSNWIRRLRLRRASQAAANPQSFRLSLVDFYLVAPPEAPQPSTAVLRGIAMFFGFF